MATEPGAQAIHERSVIWQRLDLPGSDRCSLWRVGDGWRLSGIALVACEGEPVRAEYAVECDADWRTREVTLLIVARGEERRVRLRADGAGAWRADGEPLRAVRGCLDVDLGVTPATNTLPIRRLGLAIGEGAAVTAAWVRFPELAIEPLRQRYTRLSPDRYRYECPDLDFVAELVVGEAGLLDAYEGGWRRVGG